MDWDRVSHTDVQACIKAHVYSSTNSDEIKMQKKVLLPLVLLFSQVLADSVDFGNVCSVPKPDDHEAVTVLQGISGALLPFVVAQPEFGVPAELLVQGLNSAVSIWVSTYIYLYDIILMSLLLNFRSHGLLTRIPMTTKILILTSLWNA